LSSEPKKKTGKKKERKPKKASPSNQAPSRVQDRGERPPHQGSLAAYLRNIGKAATQFCLRPIRWFCKLSPIEQFNCFIALFTALLFCTAAIQTWAFVQSERAFMSVATLNIPAGLVANKPLEVAVGMRNSGRTTAFIEAFNVTIGFRKSDHSLPPDPRYEPGAELAPGNVVPGAVAPINSHLRGIKGEPDLVLLDADVVAINDATFILYFYGFISYRDTYSIFGDRITGYCYRYVPQPDPRFVNCDERTYNFAR
jgi:hypothetical protein